MTKSRNFSVLKTQHQLASLFLIYKFLSPNILLLQSNISLYSHSKCDLGYSLGVLASHGLYFTWLKGKNNKKFNVRIAMVTFMYNLSISIATGCWHIVQCTSMVIYTIYGTLCLYYSKMMAILLSFFLQIENYGQ